MELQRKLEILADAAKYDRSVPQKAAPTNAYLEELRQMNAETPDKSAR